MVARNVVMMSAQTIFTNTAMSWKKMSSQHGDKKCSHDEGMKCFHTNSHVFEENVRPTWWPEMW